MSESVITGLAGLISSLLMLWVGFSLRRMMKAQDDVQTQITAESALTRAEIGRVHKRLDEEAERRHACQLHNSMTFATKLEVNEIGKKVDTTNEKVIRLEVQSNG